MVKTWAEEVEEARRVIEPVVEEIDIAAWLSFDPSYGFDTDEVALDLHTKQGTVRVIVSYEAWSNAVKDTSNIRDAFSQILRQMKEKQPKNVIYVITSTGLRTWPSRTQKQRLLDEIASVEADAEIERFKKIRVG